MAQATRWSLTRLRQCIKDEQVAEKAANQAEGDRRRTWWATTWALAAIPRAEWGEAQDEYVKRTGHSKTTADHRRRTGIVFPQTVLAYSLPQPRFAQAAATWVGSKNTDEDKVKEAVKLLADAERNEQSLREFSQALTGRPWTNAPENLTEADEDAVVERVIRQRPQHVARAVVNSPKATRAVHEEQLNRVTTPEQRDELIRSNEERGAEMEAASAEMFTRDELTGMVDHEATLAARAARMHLRIAAREYERNSLMHDWQRAETDAVLAECEHLIALLRGDTGEWTDGDREFLIAVGIEESS